MTHSEYKAEVAHELGFNEMSLGNWVRDERRRIEAAKGTNVEPLSALELDKTSDANYPKWVTRYLALASSRSK